jgi:hypothetical protein
MTWGKADGSAFIIVAAYRTDQRIGQKKDRQDAGLF